MNCRLFRWGHWGLIVLKPHDWAFGHLGLEILIALQLARNEGAAVYFFPPERVVNRALLELECPGVTIIRQGGFGALCARGLWHVASLGEGIADWADELIRGMKKEWAVWKKRVRRLVWRDVRRRVKNVCRDPRTPRDLAGELSAYLDRYWDDVTTVDESSSLPAQVERGKQASYYRRSLIRHPIDVRMPEGLRKAAEELAFRAGLHPGSKLVTLHVRESGFKTSGGHEEASFDMARNARIEDYSRAVDYLVESGYQVVRIGDPTMTPYHRHGCLDLAISPFRNQLLELWCLMQSEFLLGCDSGPYAVCLLTNTPTLIVNATNPVTSYPVRAKALYILKHVINRETGKLLSLREMLSEKYLSCWRDPARYAYIDNTGDEILSAVREMIVGLEETGAESAQQGMFRQLVYRTACELRDSISYIRKWGAEDGFIGDGRIAQFFVERHLEGDENLLRRAPELVSSIKAQGTSR